MRDELMSTGCSKLSTSTPRQSRRHVIETRAAMCGSPTKAYLLCAPLVWEHLESGLPPQRWMGQRTCPLDQWGGLDMITSGKFRWRSSGCAPMASRITPEVMVRPSATAW